MGEPVKEDVAVGGERGREVASLQMDTEGLHHGMGRIGGRRQPEAEAFDFRRGFTVGKQGTAAIGVRQRRGVQPVEGEVSLPFLLADHAIPAALVRFGDTADEAALHGGRRQAIGPPPADQIGPLIPGELSPLIEHGHKPHERQGGTTAGPGKDGDRVDSNRLPQVEFDPGIHLGSDAERGDREIGDPVDEGIQTPRILRGRGQLRGTGHVGLSAEHLYFEHGGHAKGRGLECRKVRDFKPDKTASLPGHAGRR